MRHSSLSSCHKVWSLLRYTSLGLLLIFVSACHRAANLVPAGYEAMFSDRIVASTFARVDYPLIVPAHVNDDEIKIRVTKYGTRTWFWEDGYWDLPTGWKSFTWYRIGLIDDGDPIYNGQWTKAGTDPAMDIPCKFKLKVNHFSKPLVALLFFGVGGDEKNPPADDDLTNGVVSRILYLIPEP